MKKVIVLLSIVFFVGAGNASAQTISTVPQPPAQVTLKNLIISNVQLYSSIYSPSCPIPFILSNGTTVWLPAPQWIREASGGR